MVPCAVEGRANAWNAPIRDAPRACAGPRASLARATRRVSVDAIRIPSGSPHLPAGVHRASVGEVEATLVNGFPTSATRRDIFDLWIHLRAAVAGLVTLREQRLDGSYVTTKVDPGDVDLVAHLDGAEYDALEPGGQTALEALVAGKRTRARWRCDSYPLVEHPAGHPLRHIYEQQRDYSLTFFGHYRAGTPKGIVEVEP